MTAAYADMHFYCWVVMSSCNVPEWYWIMATVMCTFVEIGRINVQILDTKSGSQIPLFLTNVCPNYYFQTACKDLWKLTMSVVW